MLKLRVKTVNIVLPYDLSNKTDINPEIVTHIEETRFTPKIR